MQYHQSLEIAQTQKNKEDFFLFIAQKEKECLERYISILTQ